MRNFNKYCPIKPTKMVVFKTAKWGTKPTNMLIITNTKTMMAKKHRDANDCKYIILFHHQWGISRDTWWCKIYIDLLICPKIPKNLLTFTDSIWIVSGQWGPWGPWGPCELFRANTRSPHLSHFQSPGFMSAPEVRASKDKTLTGSQKKWSFKVTRIHPVGIFGIILQYWGIFFNWSPSNHLYTDECPLMNPCSASIYVFPKIANSWASIKFKTQKTTDHIVLVPFLFALPSGNHHKSSTNYHR